MPSVVLTKEGRKFLAEKQLNSMAHGITDNFYPNKEYRDHYCNAKGNSVRTRAHLACEKFICDSSAEQESTGENETTQTLMPTFNTE